MGKKGEVYVRKLSTVWYFYECPRKGCKIRPLRSIVEPFVLQAIEQHEAKHRHDEEKKQKEDALKAQLKARLKNSRKR